MSSSLTESLDLAVSPDYRHFQTARAATSTELGRNSNPVAYGDKLSTYASSSDQPGQHPNATSFHSLPDEHQLQHASTGDRPRGSVDPGVADEKVHSQDAHASTTEYTRRRVETEVTSSGRLGNNQHGDAGETPPQPSPHDSEASRDESDAVADNSDIPHQESVAEILSRLIPQGSHLQRSIDRRDCSMWLVDDNKMISKKSGILQDPAPVFKEMRQKIAAGCVLIIENLNSNICKGLEIEHPNLDRAFLVHHMLRFDEPIFGDDVESLEEELRLHHSDPSLCAVNFHEVPGLNISLDLNLPLFEHDKSCIHLDAVYAPLLETPLELNAMEDVMMDSIQTQTEFRHERFWRSTAGTWKKVSTRLSYCRLARDSTLILVDAAWDVDKKTYAPYITKCPAVPRHLWSYLPRSYLGRHYFHNNVEVATALGMMLLIHSRQSVFDPSILPAIRYHHRDLPRLDRKTVLVWFLVAAFWEKEYLCLQDEVKYLRSFAMREAGQRSFPLLKGARGHLAHVRDGISSLRDTMHRELGEIAGRGWYVRTSSGNYEFQLDAPPTLWEEGKMPKILLSPVGGNPTSLDWRDLPAILGQLETWIDEIGKTINEEIQMAIGAVQVEDARVMKRQTEWTVVLGILAAIYLPLTLVTGIFGMNITEIASSETAPNRSSVVKVWAIIFGATLGSIYFYTIMESVRRCWRILRLLFKRLREYTQVRRGLWWLHDKLEVLRELEPRLGEWLTIVEKVIAFTRKVKEWDLEAQNMD